MPGLTAEVLRVWQASEELLDELPPIGVDHESVHILTLQLGALYVDITSSLDRGNERVRDTLAVIDSAWDVLAAARGRLSGRQGPTSIQDPASTNPS